MQGIGHTKFKKTSIGVIPEQWELVDFAEVMNEIKYGTSVKCEIKRYEILSRTTDFEETKRVQGLESRHYKASMRKFNFTIS
jgi:hypothetical protein